MINEWISMAEHMSSLFMRFCDDATYCHTRDATHKRSLYYIDDFNQ
jgi:hypothetical protein